MRLVVTCFARNITSFLFDTRFVLCVQASTQFGRRPNVQIFRGALPGESGRNIWHRGALKGAGSKFREMLVRETQRSLISMELGQSQPKRLFPAYRLTAS